MSVGLVEYYAQIINRRTQKPSEDDTGVYTVMTAGSSALATIYTNKEGSSSPAYTAVAGVANTITDGIIRFWTAASVTSVDLTIVTDSGDSIFVSGLKPSDHRIEIDKAKREQVMIIPFFNTIPTPFVSATLTASASVWGTGFSIPANAIVKECYARVETLGTAAVLNVGVSGTPSGYLVAVTADTTGYKVPLEPYLSATATFSIGTLLMASTTSAVRRGDVNAAATAIVFGNVTVTTLAASKGWIFIKYDKLPV